jgi:LPS sulfotransferase NodH
VPDTLTARLLLRHTKPLKLPERLLAEPDGTAIFADQEMREALTRRAEALAGRLLPLESLTSGNEFDGSRIVLCSLNELGETRSSLEETRPDLPTRSLTGDYLLAAACGLDPWDDLAALEDDPLPGDLYAIACLPRSGSTFFCHLLQGLGTVARPTEHLRPHIVFLAAYARELGFDPVRWTKLVMRTDSSGDVFGSKIIYDFAAEFWPFLTKNQRTELSALFSGLKLIHLERTDKIAQSVSQFIADETRVWHVRQQGDEDAYRDAKQAVHYDSERLRTIHALFVSSEAALRDRLRGHDGPVHHLSYEALVRDPQQAVSDAVAFIQGAPAEPVHLTHEKYYPMSDEINRAFADKFAAELERDQAQ